MNLEAFWKGNVLKIDGFFFVSLQETVWRFSPGSFGVFGWVETFMKFVGCSLGVASVSLYSAVGGALFGFRIVQIVCVCASAAIHTALIAQKIMHKEAFAFFFSLFIVAGHAVMALVLFQNNGTPGSFVFGFSFCFFLGEGCRYFVYLYKPPNLNWRAYVWLQEEKKRYALTTIIMLLMFLTWSFQIVTWILMDFET